jgi:hypothetical protein
MPQAIHRTASLARRLPRRTTVAVICLLWAVLVLYPNPLLLPRAIAHAYNPTVDPAAVQAIAAQLPDDPAYIEQYVNGTLVPYAVPWQTYGVPWYYPTPREVLAKGGSDCEGRAVVFASILKAKGIPFTLRASFDHIWVEYPSKQPNPSENASIAIMDDGHLQVPQSWDWHASYELNKEYFWDPAPLSRKLLLFGGLAAILFYRQLARLALWLRARYMRRIATAVNPLAGD